MPSRVAPVTEAEFWQSIQLLSIEIENAAIIFHTWEELNRLAVEDPKVFRVLNEDAQFWLTHRHCLQTSLFMTLGRIFDTDEHAISIHKVVRDAIANVQWFSREALTERKRDPRLSSEALNERVSEAWVPGGPADLRHLKKELSRRNSLLKKAYLPIRHQFYAHKLMGDDEAAFELFRDTKREEIGNIIDFLHDLIDAFQDLYSDGIRPKFGRLYIDYNRRIRAGTERVLRKLVAAAESRTRLS